MISQGQLTWGDTCKGVVGTSGCDVGRCHAINVAWVVYFCVSSTLNGYESPPLSAIRSLETGNLSRVTRMSMYGTFIMAPGQCHGEPTCYMCILELPWYDYRWGSEKVSKRVI
ncbi:hypothetical protein L6452_43310 [Arctium lappa]|uniref:Uncharacterized protein n=1 Tax=Arctium lappa TaxID=4217 RepID=A0ACB8XK16_ARCLA|nr:hypothetical protein L6452_43310 [Arctium lappa]